MKHPEWKFLTAEEMRRRGATYKQISVTVRVPESTVRSWWSHRRPRLVSSSGNEESEECGGVLVHHDDRLFVPSDPIPFSSVSVMQKWSDETIRDAIKLRDSGMPLRKMSSHMKIPFHTLKDWFYGRGRAVRLKERENQTQTLPDAGDALPRNEGVQPEEAVG